VNTPLQPRAAHAVLLEGPLDVRLSAGPEPQLADPQAFAPPATVQHLLVRTGAGLGALCDELTAEAARLDSFACRAGLQPQLVRQFVAYGLLDPGYARPSSPGAAPPGTSPPVSGAGAVLVLLDLVDRVHALEASVAGRGVGGPDITNGRGGA
jgi:hypothetical protein